MEEMIVALKIWNLKKTEQLYNILVRSGERSKTERHFFRRKRKSDASSTI